MGYLNFPPLVTPSKMEALKELLTPKTFNKLSFVAVFVWIVLGVTLLGIFADMENSESRFDFRCDAKLSDKDLIRGKCFERYEKQYNKFSIPLYGFVIVNFAVVAIVAVIYSKCIQSTVNELDARRNADAEGQTQQGNETSRRLFIAYCCQLAFRFALGIVFIVLQTRVLYPSKFSSDFECTISREGNSSAFQSANSTQAQTYECHNQRATKKTFWTYAVTVVNGGFAFIVLMEIVWIMSRVRNGKKFMEDSQFFVDHLKFNHVAAHPGVQEQQHGQNAQQVPPQQVPLQAFIKSMKDTIIKDTEQPTGLEQPIRHNPGEGPKPKDFKIDQIYVNLVICEDRAYYDFPKGRWEQLKVYPKPANVNHPQSVRPDVIINAQHKNVLVVGRPGIGKTLLCTKLLRMWASDDTFNGDFNAAFLLKFRHFNSNQTNINFRELLESSETVSEHLDDEVWDYIIKNPTKVLLIFDGLDEFSARSDITSDDSRYKNNVEEKMPLHCLYHKIASGKLLDGATVITTTRPTAVKCIRPLNVDRTVEILGFTSQEVEDYVEKFTEGDHDADAKQTIWQHISTNINLFSLCYIPVNCFIICSCLSYLHNRGSRLPTELTKIYSIAVKFFFFRHNAKYRFSPNASDQNVSKDHELPSQVQDVFKSLGKIAFNGIKQGRLIFGSREVNGLEDCGLLHRLPDRAGPTLLEPREAQFCFTHLTIQEFLAAKHVIDTMRNEQELRRFVADHINEGAWQVVLQFVAGLLEPDPHRKEHTSDIFTELLPMSTVEKKEDKLMMADFWSCKSEETEVRTFTCWPADNDQEQLALNLCKCLYEIDVKQDSEIQNKLTEIGFNAVDFSSCSLAPVDCSAVLNVLKNATGLLCMTLKGNNIGPLGCIEIKNWIVNSDDSNNKYCKLRGINISDRTDEAEALTNNNCKLNSLDLSGNNITNEGVKHLAEALTNNNCKLNSLDLSGNNITDEGVKHLAEALTNNNCKLNSLTLSGNTITDEGVKHLAEALTHNNCKLNSLNLARNNITAEGVKHLAEALTNNNCKLNSLTLPGNTITDEGVKHLAEALTNNNCKLNSLTLAGKQITAEGVKHLAEALTNNNCELNSLTLIGIQITDEGVKHLAEALTNNNCKLNSLTLRGGQITDEGVKHLAEALTNNNCKLKSLTLGGKQITDEGVKHLAEALTNNNCKLKSLTLAGKQITDEGVKHLAEALTNNNCNLNSLDLSGNNITDEGVKHLAEALTNNNCKLNSLDLARNNITAEGVKHLAEALTNNNCKLNNLHLFGNNITDEGVKHLAEALTGNNCILNSLLLSLNCLSDEGLKYFAEALKYNRKLRKLILTRSLFQNNKVVNASHITKDGVQHLKDEALRHSNCNVLFT